MVLSVDGSEDTEPEEEEEWEEEDEEETDSAVVEEEGSVYIPFKTSLRELLTGVLSDVLPYTQYPFPSTLVPFQSSFFTSISA